MVKPVFTPQEYADQLTRNGFHWGDTTITYSFPAFGSSGIYGVDLTQQAWLREAMDLVSDIIDVTFVESSPFGGSDIEFYNHDSGGTYTSWSYYGSTREFAYAEIYFDQSWSTNQSGSLSYGSYGFTTMLHEFLHAMGLAHPGDYNAGSGGPITYAGNAEFEQDTHRYSVMSYFAAYEDGSGTSHYFNNGSYWEWIYPQSPMVYDILALQSGDYAGYFGGYAPNTTTRTGDTVYGYNANADRDIFDFTINAAPVLTVYDAGGIDTLDLSGDTASDAMVPTYDGSGNFNGWQDVSSSYVRVIDLAEGAYSSTHGMSNNIGIAFGTVIENAIGTGFADSISGNGEANALDGGAGDDSLNGLAGADFLTGGADGDTFVFDLAALADAELASPIVDEVADYNQGNTGTFSAAEGDKIDVSALVAAAYGAGQSANALVRVVMDSGGAFAELQIDIDGSGTDDGWVTIARLDGLAGGQSVSVILDSSEPAGVLVPVSVQATASSDFEGDGASDLIWRSSIAGTTTIWDMENLQHVASNGLGAIGITWHVEGTGDFDGDGDPDILWRNENGSTVVWEMQGVQHVASSDRWQIGTGWQIEGTGDFDGDGDADILWRSDDGTTVIWDMQDLQHVGGSDRWNVGSAWEVAGTDDFDGDGDADILWRANNGETTIWGMQDFQHFDTSDRWLIGVTWSIEGSGDFDGDGDADILWRNDDGTTLIWEMQGLQHVGGSERWQVSDSWTVEGVGDFDGDGDDDILWRNNDGTTSIWGMDDLQHVASNDIGLISSAWDVIV